MRLTIDRFDGDHVVFRTDAGQELIVPRDEVPATAQVNDALRVSFAQEETTASARVRHAKDVLNEILGGNDE